VTAGLAADLRAAILRRHVPRAGPGHEAEHGVVRVAAGDGVAPAVVLARESFSRLGHGIGGRLKEAIAAVLDRLAQRSLGGRLGHGGLHQRRRRRRGRERRRLDDRGLRHRRQRCSDGRPRRLHPDVEAGREERALISAEILHKEKEIRRCEEHRANREDGVRANSDSEPDSEPVALRSFPH
jgi:hypothetical protein